MPVNPNPPASRSYLCENASNDARAAVASIQVLSYSSPFCFSFPFSRFFRVLSSSLLPPYLLFNLSPLANLPSIHISPSSTLFPSPSASHSLPPQNYVRQLVVETKKVLGGGGSVSEVRAQMIPILQLSWNFCRAITNEKVNISFSILFFFQSRVATHTHALRLPSFT